MPATSALHRAVEREAKCPAVFITSQTVFDEVAGEEFTRQVETYALRGHATANKAYVWQIESTIGTAPEYKVILGIPPINSAEAAVRSRTRAITNEINRLVIEED